VLRQFQLTPPHIIEEVSAFITAAFIAVVYIAAVLTGEPTIVEAIIVVVWPLAWRLAPRLVRLLLALPLPEHITHRAADTIPTARATDWPLSSVGRRTDRRDAGLASEKRGTDNSHAPQAPLVESDAAISPIVASSIK
jgi:hypothetical protein